jgi:hypothetical protein
LVADGDAPIRRISAGVIYTRPAISSLNLSPAGSAAAGFFARPRDARGGGAGSMFGAKSTQVSHTGARLRYVPRAAD